MDPAKVPTLDADLHEILALLPDDMSTAPSAR